MGSRADPGVRRWGIGSRARIGRGIRSPVTHSCLALLVGMHATACSDRAPDNSIEPRGFSKTATGGDAPLERSSTGPAASSDVSPDGGHDGSPPAQGGPPPREPADDIAELLTPQQRAARVQVDALEVRGSVPDGFADMIRGDVKDHIDDIRNCYQVALRDRADLSGEMTVRFAIEPPGGTSNVRVRTRIGAPRLEGCVSTRIDRWIFAAPPGGAPLVVEARFVLTTS